MVETGPAWSQVIGLDHDFGDTFGGVLTNAEGHMTALWANFNEQAGNDDMEEYCRGIPVSIIKPWLQQVPHPHAPTCRLIVTLFAVWVHVGTSIVPKGLPCR